MTVEIPQYGLRAYSLLFSRHGEKGRFGQSELDWLLSQSMKKKTFSLLLRSGWIEKRGRNAYSCTSPAKAITGILEFKLMKVIHTAQKEYAFSGLSSIEIWSDYAYTLRSIEKSPYFIKVLKKDIAYWKDFFGRNRIQHYMGSGSAIGEYVILNPVGSLEFQEKDGICVEPLPQAMEIAKSNEIYRYAFEYMKKKYGDKI